MSRKDFGAKPLSYPQPVFIIATYDENGVPDAMNAAWGGICGESQVLICLDANHKTVKNLLKTRDFTISMADAPHAAACDYVGIVSGNNVPDKVARSGLTVTQSTRVNAPILNELAVCLECTLVSFDPETDILIGEIVNVSVDESALTDGQVDVAKVAPIVFDPFNHAYHVLGEKVGDAWSIGAPLVHTPPSSNA